MDHFWYAACCSKPLARITPDGGYGGIFVKPRMSDEENYSGLHENMYEIRLLFDPIVPPEKVLSVKLEVFEDNEDKCVERVALATDGSFQRFLETLAVVAERYTTKGSHFSVVLVHEQRNANILSVSQYNVYESV